MKVLTLQFLTCAIKTCKAKSLTAQPLSQATTAADDDVPATSSPFPLHPVSATLERNTIPLTPLFILNILPRLDWTALKITATEFGLVGLLPGKGEGEEWETVQTDTWRTRMLTHAIGGQQGEGDEGEDVEMDEQPRPQSELGAPGNEETDDSDEKILQSLHSLLLETEMMDGKLVCGSCGHEYGVKEGVGNFLLPAHLV